MSSPNRRWNPLRKMWVLNSPHRTLRPWSGERGVTEKLPNVHYDPQCPLCPGNIRAGGIKNSAYDSIFAFDNDFPALVLNGEVEDHEELNGIIMKRSARGGCRVICYSPNHSANIGEMAVEEIVSLIDAWGNQYTELSSIGSLAHIMIFENRGQMMGASNPHPHGQIWATGYIPDIPHQIAESQKEYYLAHGRHLLVEYRDYERAKQERVILENEGWLVVVPFWAVWPFEALVLPKRVAATVAELSTDDRASWAQIMRMLVAGYDRVFETAFPYSMGLYQRPCDGEIHPGYMVHQTFFPPLLRSASIRKHMVGYELCAEPQRDISPEEAAGVLREACR